MKGFVFAPVLIGLLRVAPDMQGEVDRVADRAVHVSLQSFPRILSRSLPLCDGARLSTLRGVSYSRTWSMVYVRARRVVGAR